MQGLETMEFKEESIAGEQVAGFNSESDRILRQIRADQRLNDDEV